MPIYEYECEECRIVIEEWQSLSDEPKTTCPSCSGSLKKLISQSSFQLKGGGWYADGYSSSPSKNNKSCSTSSCAASCSSTKESDKKPACADSTSTCKSC